ncbi:hypothetical protein F4680DRAFT_453211 [Xylaria scruposa]|nr:hypothetical protein F4680DRAFT_453211 [Xylaria scruposa]
MDSRATQPPNVIQFMIELAKMHSDLQSDVKKMFSLFSSRLDELDSMITTKIRIPCPVDRCSKVFGSNGHRNRHIRANVKKGPQKDTLFKQHEQAAKRLDLISDEDLSSDNDTDMRDDVHAEPQIRSPALSTLAALLGNPDDSPLEIRASPEPPLTEYHHVPTRFWQPMPVYQDPDINDFVPTSYPNGGVDQFEHQDFQHEWGTQNELLTHQFLEFLRQDIPGSGSDANQQWGVHGYGGPNNEA